MAHYRISVPCRRCGVALENPDRIKRALWQVMLFPKGGRFRCSGCGHKQLVPVLGRYRVKPMKSGLSGTERQAAHRDDKQREAQPTLTSDDVQALRAIVIQQQKRIKALQRELERMTLRGGQGAVAVRKPRDLRDTEFPQALSRERRHLAG